MGRWKERRVVGALELVNKEEGIVVADRQKRNEIRLYFSLLLDIPSSTRERRNIVYEGRRIKLPLSVDEALQGLLVRCVSIIRSASELDVRSWKGRERMEIRDNGSRRNRAARGETNSIDTRQRR